jgi:serine/threonine protein kinase
MTQSLTTLSLAEILTREGRLPVEQALRIIRALCDALTPLHVAGMAHGGVNPERVQLGENDHVELLKASPNALPLFYLAPELLSGHRPTPSSDVYALGALLYVMLTNSDTQVNHSLLLQHVTPRWLERVLSRALAANPRERYADASSLADSLASPQLADQWTPPARRAGRVIPDLRDLSWRQKGVALAASLLAITLLIALLRPAGEQKTASAYGFWPLGSATLASPTISGSATLWSPTPPAQTVPLALAPTTALAATTPSATPTGMVQPTAAPPTATALPPTATIAIPTPTSTATLTHTSLPPTLTPSASLTPTRPPATATATALAPTRVPPTNTPIPPTATYTPTPDLYPAPVPISPPNGFWGEIVTLEWSWPNTLKDNEWFDVQVWRQGQEPQGIAWTKEPRHVVSGLTQGQYFWRVAVIQGRGGSWEKQLTPPSATWSFNRP